MMIKPQKYRIAFVFDTLYYPFTYPEILNSLAERKYKIIAAPPQGDPLLSGARIYVSGFIASTKSGCFIQLNESSKLIACEGTSADNVVATARDIIDLSKEVFKLDIPNDIDYSELTASEIVSENGNPLETIKGFSGDGYNVFNEILENETSGYSIRIIPKTGIPTDRKWFDISITPRFSTSEREYHIETVFRNAKDVESVLDFTSKLDEKIAAIITKIGGS
jgi:hypothetical protein